MRLAPLLGALVALAVGLLGAGCGGGSSFYDDRETSTCLEGRGLAVSHEDADYIALAAINGGYLVSVGETRVNVSFYRNGDDARQNLKAYEVFGGEVGDTLYAKDNAVFAWDDTPTSDEKESVDGCLTVASSAVAAEEVPSTLTDATGGVSSTGSTPPTSVSDAEVLAYYTQNQSQYGTPESRDVRHILVAEKGANGQVNFRKSKATAEQIYAQLAAGADFALLAKEYSADPGSKDFGGKLTISRGQTVPEFDKVSFALDKGEISKPVKTQYGYHVIEAVSDVRNATLTPLNKVKAAIRAKLLQEKRRQQTPQEESTCDRFVLNVENYNTLLPGASRAEYVTLLHKLQRDCPAEALQAGLTGEGLPQCTDLGEENCTMYEG